uniref:NADH-ubiquinone oxidoreductase chain 2 n=1 Tax=Lophosaurus dilophus TaxID=118208 RepID=Q9G680_LOPDL|nr:NADH dehydrogenase subunit 2 [Lophosaurus dilophus]
MPTTALFMITAGMTTSTLMVTLSHHWLMAWLALELNTISILPMITKQKHPRSAEAATKYFLTQAVASSLMLFSSTLNAWQTGSWYITQLDNKLAYTLMVSALVMKMGAAPAHFWLPEVLQGSTLFTSLVITTWQKVAPMTLLYMIPNHNQSNILLVTGMLSVFVGGWGGINQTQLRKMMAFSSIAHLGWTMVAMSAAPNISLLNIFIYMIMSTPAFLMFATMSVKTLRDMTTAWTTCPLSGLLMMLLLLSMAGLPPLAGFTPKLLILNVLVMHKSTATAAALAMLSLLSLIFYLRMAYLLISMIPPATAQSETLWRLKAHHTQLTAILMPFALFNITILPALIF